MAAWGGITGGVGSGKSMVAADFCALGVPVLDADAESRRLTQTAGSDALEQIAAVFGSAAIDVSGCLNRAYMRERVFADIDARRRLENILHPLILDAIREQQAQYADVPYGVVEIPNLVEHPAFQKLVSRVLVVDCPEILRVKRVMQRSGLTEAAVRAIMAAQADDSERLRLADDVVSNTGSPEDLRQAVSRLHGVYLRLFQAA